MKFVFWVSAALLFYTFAGYPLLMVVYARLRKRQVKQAKIEPRVSIVIAAHNEAAVIAAKLANLAQLDYPAECVEIIVASDGSDDGTDDIVRRSNDVRVRLISCPRLGKASALNQAVAAARGEIVCFTDARQMVEHAALRSLVRNFADPEVGCVSGELMLVNSSSEPSGLGLYWKIEKLVRQAESDTGSVIGATGALYAVRRELVPKLPAGIILDDVFIPLQVARLGKRILFESDAQVWDALSTDVIHEFRRKTRTLAGNYQLVQKSPSLLLPSNPLWFPFVSHKLSRLAAPAMLVAALLSSWALAEERPYFLLAVVQTICYSGSLVVLKFPAVSRRFKIANVVFSFCMLNAAAAYAFFQFFRSRNDLSRLWMQQQRPTTSRAAAQGQ